jgi:MYXO-CTERM domain-containing protein
MKGRWSRIFCALFVLTGVGALPAAAQVSIDFSSATFGSNIDGQTIQDVRFNYMNPDGSRAHVTNGPGCTNTFVCDPSVVGSTRNGASLVMGFLNPLSSFGFGLVVNVFSPAQAFVELFSPAGISLGIQTLTLQSTGSFSGTTFTHAGAAISSARISFASAPYTAFALDNITGTTVTPEPFGVAMLIAGLAGMAGAARRRRRTGVEVAKA